MPSRYSYPLTRTADTDVGGAADLQTDVMRFMAILLMCLVAIFALVQSMPLTPTPVPQPDVVESVPEPVPEPVPLIPEPDLEPVRTEPAKPVEEAVVLTRPKWIPKPLPERRPVIEESPPLPVEESPKVAEAPPPPVEAPAPVEEPEGFTLRFESDAALMRLVAMSKVGVYAIDADRARRMSVTDSKISFWDASTPNSFHEMEPTTVPMPVVDALARTGIIADSVSWGVTLPGKLSTQLETLMREHRGGALVIESSGNIRWEAIS